MTSHRLEEIVSLDKLTLTLDSVAKATGMNLCVLDTLGNIIIYPCNDAIFCKCARQDPAIRTACLAAASHASFEAARRGKTHYYKCTYGLIDFSVPLFYKGEHIGAICGGSTRSNISDDKLDYIYAPISLENHPELKKIYDNMPQVEEERFLEMSKLVSKLADYINHFGILLELEDHSTKTASNYNKLQPALRYIEQHYKSQITIHELAALCMVSPTYFSRLFSQTMKTTLSQYILSMRISKAKELLKNRSIKIQAVAAEVGYDDPAYFIRKFKQVTGLTPSEYQAMSSSER